MSLLCPVASQDDAPQVGAQLALDPAMTRHICRTVLVVDDDPDIRLMLRFVLEDIGYGVLEARNGVEGLNALRAAGGQHLIVLLDYRMPRMDGWEMLRAAAGDGALAGRHTFALVTANAETLPPAFRRLLEELAIPILAKPFHLDELDAFVGRCAAQAEAASGEEW